MIPPNAPFSEVPALRGLLCLLLSKLNSFHTEEHHEVAKSMEGQTVFSVLVLDPPPGVPEVAVTGEETFLKLGWKHAGLLKVHHPPELGEPWSRSARNYQGLSCCV